jgi:3-dehydroquinate dehydratase-2
MDSILVLHGPNLNLLGIRETNVYGIVSLDEINQRLVKIGEELGWEIKTFQSNSEGALIDALQDARISNLGVIFNPGGYTHTSIALRDAVSAIQIPVIEVHVTNPQAREEFRHHSYISAVSMGTIAGFGWYSYVLALHALSNYLITNKPAISAKTTINNDSVSER